MQIIVICKVIRGKIGKKRIVFSESAIQIAKSEIDILRFISAFKLYSKQFSDFRCLINKYY